MPFRQSAKRSAEPVRSITGGPRKVQPMKPYLKLKTVETASEETLRIYSYVRNTVDAFNYYVADFFESVAILTAKSEALKQSHRIDEAQECEQEVSYLHTRIEELRMTMQMIASEMAGLVEYGQDESWPDECMAVSAAAGTPAGHPV